MTAHYAGGDSEQRHRVANLQVNTHARQETPVGLDERTACRQIDDVGGASGTEARSLHSLHRECQHSRGCAPLASHRATHTLVPKLNSSTRVRPVAPSTRTAN